MIKKLTQRIKTMAPGR